MSTQNKLALTVTECADQTGLCRDVIYDAIRDESLPARRLGRRTLILASDLAEFIRSLPRVTKEDLARGAPVKAIKARAAKYAKTAVPADA